MNKKIVVTLLLTLVSTSACKSAAFRGSGKNKDAPNSVDQKPSDPVTPSDPTQPADPSKPIDPIQPADPSKPIDPSHPGPRDLGEGDPGQNSGQNTPGQNPGQNPVDSKTGHGESQNGQPTETPTVDSNVPSPLQSCQATWPDYCVQPYLAKPLSTVKDIGSNQKGVRLYGKQDEKNLHDFTLVQSCLSNSSLVRGTWDNVKFHSNELLLANFADSKWFNSQISHSDLRQGNWGRAELTDTRILNSCLDQANFGNAVLTRVNLSGSYANRVNFGALEVHGVFHFKNGRAEGALFDKSVFHGPVSFANTSLKGASFVGVEFKSTVDWAGAELSNAKWMDGRICGANSIGLCR